jgi:hypothetical protein
MLLFAVPSASMINRAIIHKNTVLLSQHRESKKYTNKMHKNTIESNKNQLYKIPVVDPCHISEPLLSGNVPQLEADHSAFVPAHNLFKRKLRRMEKYFFQLAQV